jgi:subtilisin family serine protease
VDAGANVISMSLGGGGSTRFEEFLYNYVAAQNILVVAAAGNSGDNSISYPAGYASVMSVAAVDSSMNWAPFSQFNADVEIAAPGVGVLSTIPQGSQTGATLTVGASVYSVQAMEGSPLLEIAGPLADFGLGDVVQWGTMKDKVCLISRGSISFADKVKNCQRSGGIGAVIYNNVDGELLGTLGNARTNIPSVGATMADGQAMLSQVDQTASVAVFASDDLYAARFLRRSARMEPLPCV